MPKRVIDFDAMWGSDKLGSCAVWAQVEYAWLYGLADASGCFEVTNLRVIWGRVAANRSNLTIERLEQVFAEFEEKGLLFVWEHEGKRYAHWTGSDVPGRLPPPSWRVRMEKYAPPVPKQRLAEYMARFARGRAAMGPAGFRGETERGVEIQGQERKGDFKSQISNFKEGPEVHNQGRMGNLESRNLGLENSELRRAGNEDAAGGGIKGGVEEDQGQDWDLNLGLDWKLKGKWGEGGEAGADGNMGARAENGKWGGRNGKSDSFYSKNTNANSNATASAKALNRENSNANANSGCTEQFDGNVRGQANANANENASWMDCSGGRRKGGLTPIADVNWEAVEAEQVRRSYGEQPRLFGMSAKELALQRELRVGMGPVIGPARVRPEVLERIRLRELARAKAGKGSG